MDDSQAATQRPTNLGRNRRRSGTIMIAAGPLTVKSMAPRKRAVVALKTSCWPENPARIIQPMLGNRNTGATQLRASHKIRTVRIVGGTARGSSKLTNRMVAMSRMHTTKKQIATPAAVTGHRKLKISAASSQPISKPTDATPTTKSFQFSALPSRDPQVGHVSEVYRVIRHTRQPEMLPWQLGQATCEICLSISRTDRPLSRAALPRASGTETC